MSAIDYVNRAEALAGEGLDGDRRDYTHDERVRMLMTAQVHATLALVDTVAEHAADILAALESIGDATSTTEPGT